MAYNQKIMRMKELIEKLTEADIAYYKNDDPIMTDREYDLLFDELAKLETETSLMLSGSPTQKVSGEILESLTPVTHSKPMLSADKTKSVDDLIKFAKGRDVLLSWKLDGLTIVLRYKDGKLEQAITRGAEGIVGEDVTHTVKTFVNVPLTIPEKSEFEVRGEGVVSYKNFNEINLGLDEPYTLPRAFASASTRKLNSNESKERRLEFFAFDIVSENNMPSTKTDEFEFMERNGFQTVPHVYLNADSTADIIKAAVERFEPKLYGYPVDGLIMEYNDIAYGKSLGATGHHENRLIALKWKDELYDTKFLGVRLATTRTGMVSITALLEPVTIDGTVVTHASLHNVDIFEKFKFGIGDTVKIYKANMIIPQVAENATQSGTYSLPMVCPCCGQLLEIDKTSGGTRVLRCNNQHCTAKLVRKFVHFCDKTRMNINGIAESTLETFVSSGWVKNFGDLYELEQHHDEIVDTDGFGEKSYQRMQKSIDASRKCTLNQFIAGLGIPMVGRSAGRILNKHFGGDWNAFEDAIKSGFDFTVLKDFGETMNNNIHKWYADKDEEKLWRPLLTKIEFIKEENKTMSTKITPLYKKTVVATGKLENYTRDGIQNKLIELGAVPASSVTKKTDYLIVGEKAGSKLQKARELGIPTLTEAEFEDLISD